MTEKHHQSLSLGLVTLKVEDFPPIVSIHKIIRIGRPCDDCCKKLILCTHQSTPWIQKKDSLHKID
jgi:hypothetical protein